MADQQENRSGEYREKTMLVVLYCFLNISIPSLRFALPSPTNPNAILHGRTAVESHFVMSFLVFVPLLNRYFPHKFHVISNLIPQNKASSPVYNPIPFNRSNTATEIYILSVLHYTTFISPRDSSAHCPFLREFQDVDVIARHPILAFAAFCFVQSDGGVLSLLR